MQLPSKYARQLADLRRKIKSKVAKEATFDMKSVAKTTPLLTNIAYFLPVLETYLIQLTALSRKETIPLGLPSMFFAKKPQPHKGYG